jgi:hypothetical protein
MSVPVPGVFNGESSVSYRHHLPTSFPYHFHIFIPSHFSVKTVNYITLRRQFQTWIWHVKQLRREIDIASLHRQPSHTASLVYRRNAVIYTISHISSFQVYGMPFAWFFDRPAARAWSLRENIQSTLVFCDVSSSNCSVPL